ncbi:hypothetical protein H257_08724 [Aphanomyces astaci]|uniref:Uncharacterized protein n=1 Tax=Aphanomyces astaci TaxID=112090 RepID=W4GC63_APHAT|nr:hypothetical protein H257_08724 [Aphanomyces astaci]ETV77272.1 hypothetical protein H257_08724 [Aphanomyces astaci]|eukprot:XP_009833059.1 hypothetical protein H257_08724 [Aphanomyces astaci]
MLTSILATTKPPSSAPYGIDTAVLSRVMDNAEDVVVDPVPPSWTNMGAFYGGNPMCVYGVQISYV